MKRDGKLEPPVHPARRDDLQLGGSQVRPRFQEPPGRLGRVSEARHFYFQSAMAVARVEGQCSEAMFDLSHFSRVMPFHVLRREIPTCGRTRWKCEPISGNGSTPFGIASSNHCECEADP